MGASKCWPAGYLEYLLLNLFNSIGWLQVIRLSFLWWPWWTYWCLPVLTGTASAYADSFLPVTDGLLLVLFLQPFTFLKKALAYLVFWFGDAMSLFSFCPVEFWLLFGLPLGRWITGICKTSIVHGMQHVIRNHQAVALLLRCFIVKTLNTYSWAR